MYSTTTEFLISIGLITLLSILMFFQEKKFYKNLNKAHKEWQENLWKNPQFQELIMYIQINEYYKKYPAKYKVGDVVGDFTILKVNFQYFGGYREYNYPTTNNHYNYKLYYSLGSDIMVDRMYHVFDNKNKKVKDVTESFIATPELAAKEKTGKA